MRKPEPDEGDQPASLWYDPDMVRVRVIKVVFRTPPTAVELKHAYQAKLGAPNVQSSNAHSSVRA